MRRRERRNVSIDALMRAADERALALGIEPDEYTLEWYRHDWPARKRIFIEREIRIRNAFDRNRLVPFTLNDAQQELLGASIEASFDTSLEDVTLKCRRLGISTYYCADYLADALVESGHHVRIVAQDPDTVRSLMRAIKEMYEKLRPEIKPASKYNSIYDLEFNDPAKGVLASRISVSTVVPGQENKGRGDTFTRLHLTEIPFWRGDADAAATALCDAARGGKISYESTAKGVGDFFHRKYIQGKLGDGGVRAHFFPWWWNHNYRMHGARIIEEGGTFYLLMPDRRWSSMNAAEREAARISDYSLDERNRLGLNLQSERDCAIEILAYLKRHGHLEANAEWHCDEVAAALCWRRQQIARKGERVFRVEYPENDVDPFAQTGGCVFEERYLVVRAQQRDPEPGHEYVVALDPSMGIDGGDPAAITVIDRHTGEQVWEWCGYRKQDALGEMCCALSDRYNAAEIVIESNQGEAAIIEVERRGYGHRLYRHIDAQTQREISEGRIPLHEALERARPGLPMTERMKRLIIGMFERAWREGEFKASSPALIEEARTFVQNGERMEARSGYHDDRIMAAAIGWFVVVNSHVGYAGFRAAGQKLPSAVSRSY